MKRYCFNHETLIVECTQEVMDSLKTYKQENGPECGGVLLGRLFPEQNRIIITKIVESRGAKKSRYNFRMNVNEMQLIMDREWHESGGKVTYLGDWHTHPQQRPKPSYTDRITFRRNYKDSIFDQNMLVYIIVGTTPSDEKAIWLGVKTENRLIHFRYAGTQSWCSGQGT